ncbi:hypothetical protein V6N13_108820 [Hibiscus sabdariffa]|uniref:Uncharacterized protein n=1 Tax=Hibiscus sabdariffa TaxID=183260 RepID=A0ABR2FNK9_9ROSI
MANKTRGGNGLIQTCPGTGHEALRLKWPARLYTTFYGKGQVRLTKLAFSAQPQMVFSNFKLGCEVKPVANFGEALFPRESSHVVPWLTSVHCNIQILCCNLWEDLFLNSIKGSADNPHFII